MKIHVYTTKAKAGEHCALCGKTFAEGERIRDRRSTVNPSGVLMCWNGRTCAERKPAPIVETENTTMTTLISWSTSGGESGRCDAKCYSATGPVCDCICGGRNHGVGEEAAIDNTRAMAEQMIETFATTKEQAAEFRASVNNDVYQLSLGF